MTVRAAWLFLDLKQLNQLTKTQSTDGSMDRAALEELAAKVKGYHGQITCFEGQTVHIVSGCMRSLVLSAIPVVGDLTRGLSGAPVVSAYQMFQDILGDFASMQVLPFDELAGSRFETLRQQRIRIHTMDLRIASVALVRGFKVLTRNLVDFDKVPGLAAEDWTRA